MKQQPRQPSRGDRGRELMIEVIELPRHPVPRVSRGATPSICCDTGWNSAVGMLRRVSAWTSVSIGRGPAGGLGERAIDAILGCYAALERIAGKATVSSTDRS